MKVTSSESKPKCKASLVTKEFRQQQGINFEQILSPIIKITTLSLVIALVVRMHLKLAHMDVKIVFLHSDLHEEVYMQQPKGFIEKSDSSLLYALEESKLLETSIKRVIPKVSLILCFF